MSEKKSSKEKKSELPKEISFFVSMKLTKSKNRTPVLFKDDADRFQSRESIKLQCKSHYWVSIELEPTPTPPLRTLKVADIDYNFKLTNDADVENKSIYEFVWSTYGIEPTHSRCRAVIPVSLKFKNYKTLNFNLQCKFYPLEDVKHISWGRQLNGIGVQCVIRRGSDLSTAESVKFS
eukprot:gene19860-21802_t